MSKSNKIKTPKHKYELGDTFHFPNITMTQYTNNKPKDNAEFSGCVAVVTKSDEYDVIINKKTSKIIPMYTMEIEDKYVSTNGITFTLEVKEDFLRALPKAYANENDNQSRGE